MDPLSDAKATTLYTSHRRYTGHVLSRGYRISDILADPRTDILEMHDASVYAVGATADVAAARVQLRKRDLLLVLPPQEHEAPTRRNNRRVENARYTAALALPDLVVAGMMRLPSRLRPESLLADNSLLPEFVAVTEVDIEAQCRGWYPARCPVAVVSRFAIQAIHHFEEVRTPLPFGAIGP